MFRLPGVLTNLTYPSSISISEEASSESGQQNNLGSPAVASEEHLPYQSANQSLVGRLLRSWETFRSIASRLWNRNQLNCPPFHLRLSFHTVLLPIVRLPTSSTSGSRIIDSVQHSAISTLQHLRRSRTNLVTESITSV